jgi:predicted lipid-binding transport protein (Tim44 family)
MISRRQQTQKRRREVLLALLAGTGGSLLLGLLPGLSVMLFVFAGFAVALFAYVALLIRLRNLAAEREMKLRFLPSTERAELAGRAMAVGETAPALLMRQSINS